MQIMAEDRVEHDERIGIAPSEEYEDMPQVIPDVLSDRDDHAAELIHTADESAAQAKERMPDQEALLAEMREHEAISLTLVTAYANHPFVSKTIFEWREPGEAHFSTDITKDILSEIAHYPLLNDDEERSLLQLLDDGVTLYKLLPNPDLCAITQAQKEFFLRAVTAHQILQLANIRLVVNLVKKYVGVSDLELVDLISEGNIGLARGVRRLLPRLGNRLSTVATQWIWQNTKRKIAETGYVVTLPEYIRTAVNGYVGMTNQLRKELGREPSNNDIALALNKNVEQVLMLGQLSDNIAFSLNESVGDNAERGDFIQAPAEQAAEGEPEAAKRLAWLRLCMKELTPREREVLGLCFGIEDGISRTPVEAGETLSISSERIRKLRSAAINKITQHHESNDRLS